MRTRTFIAWAALLSPLASSSIAFSAVKEYRYQLIFKVLKTSVGRNRLRDRLQLIFLQDTGTGINKNLNFYDTYIFSLQQKCKTVLLVS